MMESVYSIKIGGEAGQGIKSVSQNLAKVALRSGYHVFIYSEYPSLIRGGHNVVQIIFSQKEVTAPVKTVNLLIALDQNTITKHQSELVDNAVIIYNEDIKITVAELSRFRLFPMPLKKLATQAGGAEITANNVAVGAAIALMGGDIFKFFDLIAEFFGAKNEDLININQNAAKSGFVYVQKKFSNDLEKWLKPTTEVNKSIMVNGNQAVALAAITAGLQFASIYPMTPITAILEILAKHQEKYGYIYKQPEDEIAAINMAIGASYAGARSLVATSGGGFCLMTEGYGLAGMTETPLVIIEGMRGGPATGLPTWTEQGDLRFILQAHQSEFSRLVLAASDAQDAFYLTLEAFNLADKYQTPVVILVDKNICESDQSFPEFETANYQIDRGKTVTDNKANYQRYADSDDGVSPRALPGSSNFFVTNSDEHDQTGYSSEEIANRNQQMQKRLRKLATVAKNEMKEPELIGPKNAKLTIVGWGSTKGSILAALPNLPNVNFLHLTWLNPFPKEAIKKILSQAKLVLDVENNLTAQMAGLIAEQTGIQITNNLLKNDGRPIYPEEIINKVNKLLNKQ